MRFHLVYSGPLRPSGNKPRPKDVMNIRRALSPQIQNLWDTHHALQVLRETGAKQIRDRMVWGSGGIPKPREIAQKEPEYYEDCLPWLEVGQKTYMPLVRKSLDLNCELGILFLRQQDPGDLVTQAGDIDNRAKTLLDALRMPEKDEQERVDVPESGLFTLLESDTLISRLDIDTDRLLFPQTDKPDEVHLVIEVKLNVLRVGPHNMCLL
jgi:hypothetical protein